MTAQHQTLHRFELTGKGPYGSPRRLCPEKYRITKQCFDSMITTGKCRPSCSQYASPLHMVPKKEPNDWRPCGDYRRRLNSVTKRDCYSLPQLLVFNLYGKKVFSKLDLVKAYHQIQVHTDDIEKTAVTTPFGLFEFLRMTFGLRNAGQTFQRFTNTVFHSFPRIRYGFYLRGRRPNCIKRFNDSLERHRSGIGTPEAIRTALLYKEMRIDEK